MARGLRFKLVQPDGQVFDAEVAEVQLPTPNGPVTILAQHMPMVSAVGAGVVEVHTLDGDVDHYAVSGGMVTVTPHEGAIMAVDAAEHADNIDELLVRQAIDEGKNSLETQLTEAEIASTNAVVQRNLVRLEAFERRKRYHATRTRR